MRKFRRLLPHAVLVPVSFLPLMAIGLWAGMMSAKFALEGRIFLGATIGIGWMIVGPPLFGTLVRQMEQADRTQNTKENSQ